MILNVGNNFEIVGNNFEIVGNDFAIVGTNFDFGKLFSISLCPFFKNTGCGPKFMDRVRGQSLGPWNGFRLTKC